MPLFLAMRSSSRCGGNLTIPLNVLVLAVAVLAALPTAHSDSSSDPERHEGDELGSLIQTVAEGKARASAGAIVDLEAAKAPKETANYCLPEHDGVDTSKHAAKAAEQIVEPPLVQTELPRELDEQAASPESPCPIFALVAAMVLGTTVARGILSMQSSREEAAELDSSASKKRSTSRVPCKASLFEAARAGDAERVAKLLKLGAAVNSADDWGCTALHVAASAGDAKVVRILLDSGAEVDAREAWEETSLHMAARAGSPEVCSLLLAKGAEVNSANFDDRTPLLVAAAAGHRSTCEVLLDHGAGAADADDGDLPPLLASLLASRCLIACVGEGR